MQHQEVVHILMMLDVPLHKHASELANGVITGLIVMMDQMKNIAVSC